MSPYKTIEHFSLCLENAQGRLEEMGETGNWGLWDRTG